MAFQHQGTVAMARLNDPDSASSQFFLIWWTTAFWIILPNSAGYAVFALVVSGMEVVDAIGQVETTTMGNFTESRSEGDCKSGFPVVTE